MKPSARPSDESEAPVDLVHLRRYTGEDRELERQVLTLFVPDALAYLARIEAGEGKVPAHTLKGAAQAIGAWKLAALAERAERGDVDARGLRAAIEDVRAFAGAGPLPPAAEE